MAEAALAQPERHALCLSAARSRPARRQARRIRRPTTSRGRRSERRSGGQACKRTLRWVGTSCGNSWSVPSPSSSLPSFCCAAYSGIGAASAGSGYTVYATFNRIDGLAIGDSVQLAGVPIGKVASMALGPNFRAHVGLHVDDTAIALPTDSSVAIHTDGLFGRKFVMLEPGGDETTAGAGRRHQLHPGFADRQRTARPGDQRGPRPACACGSARPTDAAQRPRNRHGRGGAPGRRPVRLLRLHHRSGCLGARLPRHRHLRQAGRALGRQRRPDQRDQGRHRRCPQPRPADLRRACDDDHRRGDQAAGGHRRQHRQRRAAGRPLPAPRAGPLDHLHRSGGAIKETRGFRSLEDQVGEIIFLATGKPGESKQP